LAAGRKIFKTGDLGWHENCKILSINGLRVKYCKIRSYGGFFGLRRYKILIANDLFVKYCGIKT
jgi:hypothetical protein